MFGSVRCAFLFRRAITSEPQALSMVAPSKPVNRVVLGVIICTLVVYLVVLTLIEYSMLGVVGTLAMVEEIPPPVDTADGADEPLLDPALPVPRWRISTASGSVTSGVRKTIRYLRAEAGRSAVLRGFGYLLAYGFLLGLINGILTTALRPLLSFVADIVIPIFTPLLLWRFNNAWVHKVISKPSQKGWSDRVKEQKCSSTVLWAIFVWSFCRSIVSLILGLLIYFLVLQKFMTADGNVRFDGSVPQTVLESLGFIALSTVLMLLILPAAVILVRTQASVLPSGDEGIVLLDKALCKTSEPTDGGYKLTLIGAWRSFAWPARISLLKIYAKCWAIEFAITVLCAVVVIVASLASGSPQAGLALVARAI